MMVIVAASLIFTSFLITIELVAGAEIAKDVLGTNEWQDMVKLQQFDEITKSTFCGRFIP